MGHQSTSPIPGDPPVISGTGIACAWCLGTAQGGLATTPREPPTQEQGVWRIPDEILAPGKKRVAGIGGDRATLLALPAIRQALQQAGFDLTQADPTRVGLVLGSAFAALADMMQFAGEVKQQSPRFVSPLHFPQTVGNYAAGALARALIINGPNLTLGAGPQAGLTAVAEAAQLITAGWADLFLAGSADAIGPNLLSAMIDAGQVDPLGPFASQPAEGACFFAIESESNARKRGAKILARIIPPPDRPTPILSGDFTGQPTHDRAEVAAMLNGDTAGPDRRIFLSSRHLMGNAFAASAAAQLALAVAALDGDLCCPLWTPELTEQTTRLDSRGPVPAEADRALVVSGPDSAGRRTTIYIQRP